MKKIRNFKRYEFSGTTGVDDLIASGWLRRVVALKDVTFSNSMIEAWWRTLKHQWLYLNTLDSAQAVQRLVAFYVTEHNCHIPHSAFRGETPDEMYYGRGAEIAEQLSMARKQARMHRINANQAQTCLLCQAGPGNEVLAPRMT